MFYLQLKWYQWWMSILYLNTYLLLFSEMNNLMIINFELAIWKQLMSHVVGMFSNCVTEQSYSHQEMQDMCFHLFTLPLIDILCLTGHSQIGSSLK